MSAEVLEQKVRDDFNANYPTILSALLDGISGLTATEKANILSGVNDKQPLLGAEDIDLEAVIAEQEVIAEEMVKENELLLLEKVQKTQEKVIMEKYDPQEAKSGFAVSEVKVSSKVPATDQADYSYSPNKMQSILKVIIDTAKNVFSVNKESGQVDMIHGKSGSYIRVDGMGNVTEYITGNYKRVIDGNYVEEIRGSKAVKVKGDNFEDVLGSNTKTVATETSIKNGGSFKVKASTIHLN